MAENVVFRVGVQGGVPGKPGRRGRGETLPLGLLLAHGPLQEGAAVVLGHGDAVRELVLERGTVLDGAAGRVPGEAVNKIVDKVRAVTVVGGDKVVEAQHREDGRHRRVNAVGNVSHAHGCNIFLLNSGKKEKKSRAALHAKADEEVKDLR